jgi:hypothetical protein
MAASDFEGESIEARNASRASGRNVGSAFSSQGTTTYSLNQSVKGISIRDENGIDIVE